MNKTTTKAGTTTSTKKTILSSFKEFEKKMNLPDIDISDEEIMKEVKAVRYAKRKQ